MKVAINMDFGGFVLSTAAQMLIATRKGEPFEEQYGCRYERTDPDLIAVCEQLGPVASHARGGRGYDDGIKVVEIPDGIGWYIDNHDGKERVVENVPVRTWS